MKITPNITFDPNAREAFQTYARILRAERLDPSASAWCATVSSRTG